MVEDRGVVEVVTAGLAAETVATAAVEAEAKVGVEGAEAAEATD